MASLIPGYEYDIFISYRQKDNKHDGWVTDFVANLKGELESTFKEEISVYFDINPHDGLLETHDVGASLKEKLKCLVFIPIISRTYCDPNSFAWEHEFLAFVEQASQDQFGMKVKLPDGNVASRVLPVQIHDLDNADIKLCESILGGVLRGIEFIYNEPGVNRPLKLKEEKPGDNLNKTFYCNQINKVANAAKEIILGMKTEPGRPVIEKTINREPLMEVRNPGRTEAGKKPDKLAKRMLLSGSIVIAILMVIAAIFKYPKIFNRDNLDELRSPDGRISIAVMPFQNLTTDSDFNIWQPGLQNLLITSLSNSEELSVRQYETMDKVFGGSAEVNYASITPSFASNIALKLQANTVIIGKILETGNRIRITANLINSGSEEIYKSYEIDGNTEADFFTMTDSLSNLIKNYLEIKQLKQEHTGYDLLNAYTSSAEAFKYYIQGRRCHGQVDYNSAIELYLKALEIDTNFVSPMLMLSYAYGDVEKSGENKKWISKAYSRINSMPYDIQLQIKEVKAAIEKKPKEQIEYLKQYLEFNPYSTIKFYTIGWVYYNIEQWQDAIDALEKSIELNKPFRNIYTLWIWNYTLLGMAYHQIGEHDKEMKILEEGLKLYPSEVPSIVAWQSFCALSQEDTVKANEFFKKLRSFGQRENWPESEILLLLANVHSLANSYNKAEELFRLALLTDPQNTAIKNGLAYLLIRNNIDNSRGIDLIKQVLEAEPDNCDFLYTYGLGLYKQGKREEALEVLSKSWELKSYYDHEHFQCIREVKKAVASNKNI